MLRATIGVAVMAAVALGAIESSSTSDGWTLAFADEFDGPSGTQPNPSLWDYEVGYIRNNEMQWYRNSTENAFQANGSLFIVARAQPAMVPDPNNGGAERLVPVTSASMFTKQTFTYGRIEARLRVPPGVGTWPAFWMLGDFNRWGWPMCGEIDIMEYVGYAPGFTHSTIHCEAKNSMRNNQPTVVVPDANMTTQFVTYSAEWSPDNVTLLVAGVPVLTYKNDGHCSQVSWPYSRPFSVKLNLAIGGSWGGLHGVDPSIFPATYEIDYVRVYQRTVPPTVPSCELQRFYVSLRTNEPSINLPHMSALTADIAASQSAHDALVAGVGAVLGVDRNSSIVAIQIDAMAPMRNRTDNLVRLIFNITVHGVDAVSALQALSNVAAVNESLAGLRSLLAASVSGSGTWDVSASGPNCGTECWTVDAQGATVPAPFPFQDYGLPASIAFRTYDYGGQGVGYSDITTWNQYGASIYRSGFDGVDIGPGNTVGYAETGEFLRFGSITVPPCSTNQSQSYEVFVAAANAGGVGVLQVVFEAGAPSFDRVMARIAVLPTGSWNTVQDSVPANVVLQCGVRYAARWTFPVSNYNLDTFSIRSSP